jgi:DHA3 family macrolide efflux protein-like MFS transporter
MSTPANRQTFIAYLSFWGGQVISLLGSTIVQFVIIWWIVITYLNPIYLAIAYLLGIGVQVLFMPIAGVFVDRWNRKLILGIVDALQAAGALGLIFLFSIQDQLPPMTLYWGVIYLIALRGIMSSFHDPAARAIVPLMVPRKQLDRLNSLQFIFLGVINIIGPAIGAVLYELFPLNILIWIDVITFIIALIPLIIITIPKVENELSKIEMVQPSFFQEFREGISVIKSRQGLFALLALITLINMLEIPIIVLGPHFVYYTHYGSVQDLAFIIAASQFGMLFSGIIILIKNGWKRKTLVIVMALYIQILGYFLQVITPIGLFGFMALGAFIFGCMLPIINAMHRTIIQVVIPPELQGRVTAIATAMGGILLPFGMLASGPLADFLGTRVLFLIANVLCVMVITFMWLFTDLRSLDKYNDVDVPKETLSVQQMVSVGN